MASNARCSTCRRFLIVLSANATLTSGGSRALMYGHPATGNYVRRLNSETLRWNIGSMLAWQRGSGISLVTKCRSGALLGAPTGRIPNRCKTLQSVTPFSGRSTLRSPMREIALSTFEDQGENL